MTHNVLLAHIAAAQKLRSLAPDAKLSINFNTAWAEPESNSREDQVDTLHAAEASGP